MPLVSMVSELKKAQAGKYAIPSFNTAEMMGFEGTLWALEEKRAPGIAAIISMMTDRPHTRGFVQFIRTRAEESPVPVSILLDHGTSFEQCKQLLDYGVTDVMMSGGELPLEKNIAVTRKVVQAAHAMGAGVEGELGYTTLGSDYADTEALHKGFTKPEECERFIEETGADVLAISFGTAHGMVDGEIELKLDLLADIRQRVEVPLVLHGGSGLSDDQFREAIKLGISKINVFSEICITAGQQMIAMAQAEEASFYTYFKIGGAARIVFKERGMHYLDVFGASGKA